MLFTNIILYYVFCFLAYFTNAYSFNGFQIRDLEKNGSEFLLEAQSWSASALRSSPTITYTCNDTTLVGGYGILGTGSGGTQNQYYQRIYTGLPAHNTIYYTISFWLIDSWDSSNDYFQWSFDSIVATGWGPSYGSFKTQICGWANYKDLSNLRSFGKVSHSSSTLTFKVISQLDQYSLDESLAVRDINIMLANTSLAAGTSQYCGKTADITLSSKQCTCSEGQYYGSSTCKTCDASCDSCFGPSNSECYECASGYSWDGTKCIPCNANCSVCYGTAANQCSVCKTGYYLFENNTCLSSCNVPFVQTSSGSTNYCSKPCSGSLFYYNNGSCLGSCSSPFVQQVYQSTNFCVNPCSMSQYLYSNGSCLSTCRQYFIAKTDAGGKYCNYPCANIQFLHWNGSCLDTCSSPFLSRTGTNGQYCDFPCDNPTDYLYQNISCLSSCPSPFVPKVNPNAQYCNSPCQTNEYYYTNSSCEASCPSPYVVRTESITKYCDFPCLSTEYYYQNTSCLSGCNSPFIESSDTNGKYCSSACANSGDFYWWNGSCLGECNSAYIMRTDSMGKYCDFPCSSSEYLYQNGSCLLACSSPFTSVSAGGNFNYCNPPCSSLQYYYTNASCLSSCPSPFLQRIESINMYCDFPCLNGEYFYHNSSCLATCTSPYVIRTDSIGQYCDFPCTTSEYFALWNSSCVNSCNSPLIVSSDFMGKYCEFPCFSSEYLYQNDSCLDSCNSPAVTIVKPEGNYCHSLCGSNEYLYWNGSCLSSCDFPLTQSIHGSLKTCQYPCHDNGFLYWDGTCNSHCPTPLTTRTEGNPLKKFCDYGCNSNAFLYWDGACLNDCEAPLSSSTYKNRSFCQHPCGDTDDFIYWNFSCESDCPSPLNSRIGTRVKYCDPACLGDDSYYYWNGSCLDTCSFPLTIRQDGENEVKYCEYSCRNSEEYLYWNGTCLSECSYPLVPVKEGQKLFCQLPCNPSEYFNPVTQKCQVNCSQPYVIHQDVKNTGLLTCEISHYSLIREVTADKNTVEVIIAIEEPKTLMESAHETTSNVLKNGMLVDMLFSTHSDPNVLVVMMIIKVLKYIQFLDIEFPKKLQNLLDNSNEEPVIMNFGPSLSQRLSKKFPEHEVPHIFEKNEFHPSFLVNYFKKITTLCIVFGIGIFVSFLEKLIPKIKNKYLKMIIERLGKFLRWNLIFMIIIESMDEIILFTSLEWKTNGFESFLEIFSFLICLVIFIGGISVVLAPIYILRKMNKAKALAHLNQDYNHYLNFLEKCGGYQVLWKEFRDDTLSRQAFLSAFLGRTILTYIVACWLYHHPLVQTILYTLISCVIISYLYYVKPFKKRDNFIQALTYEIVIIIVNVLVLILAVLDQDHDSAEQVRLFIGDVVVFLLMSLSMISVGFLLAKAIKKMKKFLTFSLGKEPLLWCFENERFFLLPLKLANHHFCLQKNELSFLVKISGNQKNFAWGKG